MNTKGTIDCDCKPCRCAKVRQNRLVRVDQYREYERGRATLPHRVEGRQHDTLIFRDGDREVALLPMAMLDKRATAISENIEASKRQRAEAEEAVPLSCAEDAGATSAMRKTARICMGGSVGVAGVLPHPQPLSSAWRGGNWWRDVSGGKKR